MKKLNRPAEPISENDLACRYSHVIAAAILAAPIRSFARFCSHQLDLPLIAQISNRVSGAKLHSLTLRPMRCDTNGVPLEPAVMAKERGNVTPLVRLGRGQGEHCGFHTAGFPQ